MSIRICWATFVAYPNKCGWTQLFQCGDMRNHLDQLLSPSTFTLILLHAKSQFRTSARLQNKRLPSRRTMPFMRNVPYTSMFSLNAPFDPIYSGEAFS